MSETADNLSFRRIHLTEILRLARLHQGHHDVLLLPDVVLPKNDLGLAHEVVPETPIIIINL